MWRRLLSNHRNLRCFSSNNAPPVIAVCREESSIWERRAPLNPGHVSKLVKEGFKVLVQPSTRRAYSMTEYKLNGAVLTEDISEADLIFGVKVIPPELILPNKRYAFFSHTIKAQPENMNVLDALLAKVSEQNDFAVIRIYCMASFLIGGFLSVIQEICFMDYEKMVNENGVRLVAFGKMAGEAGTLIVFLV